MHRPFDKLLSTAIIVCWCAVSMALPSDREQGAEIKADRVDYQNGITTYSGGVIVQRGTLKIESEELTHVSSETDGVKFVAIGTPAVFQQIMEEGQNPVIAKGDRIEYSESNGQIVINDNAYLVRPNGQSISGAKIEYNIEQDTFTADRKGEERIRMVLPANTINQTNDEPEDEQQTSQP